jgi:hypothetical protein
MSLEALYNQAARNTYVGISRDRQAAMAPTNQTLVNFLDGQPKNRSNTSVADEFQTEFTRNAPGTHVAGGAQGISRNPNQSYTRWTSKSFKIAFDNEGPAQLSNGFYTNQFRPTYTDVNGLQKQVHEYTPTNGKKFGDVNNAARSRITSSPSGAPTSF